MQSPPDAIFEGHVVGRVGLQMTLWLDPARPQADVWRGIVRAAGVFAARAAGRLGWWSSTAHDDVSWLSTMSINSLDEDLSSDSAEALRAVLQPIDGDLARALAQLGDASKLDSAMLELVLGGNPAQSDAWQGVMGWMFYANVPVQDSEVAGFVRVHLPLETDAGTTWLREFMRACVQALPVLHGTGGWGVQLPLSFRFFQVNLYASTALFELVQAHAGLDIYDPAEMAIDFTRGSYTVNWLNYLGDALRKFDAGAPELVEGKATEGVEVQRLGDGDWVQAGAVPRLFGSWTAGSALEPVSDASALAAYRTAATLLRGWRVVSRTNECISRPPYGYADEAAWRSLCDGYLTRFD